MLLPDRQIGAEPPTAHENDIEGNGAQAGEEFIT